MLAIFLQVKLSPVGFQHPPGFFVDGEVGLDEVIDRMGFIQFHFIGMVDQVFAQQFSLFLAHFNRRFPVGVDKGHARRHRIELLQAQVKAARHDDDQQQPDASEDQAIFGAAFAISIDPERAGKPKHRYKPL